MTVTQAQARHELEKMHRLLSDWLVLRRNADAAADGSAPALVTPEQAQDILKRSRDPIAEARLANELRKLLMQVYDPAVVPLDKLDAVALADIVVTGQLPTSAASPQAQGIAPMVLLVAFLGFAWLISSVVNGYVRVERDRERANNCRLYGRECEDSSVWKWIVIGGGVFLLFGGEIKHWLGLARDKARRSRAHSYLER